MFINNITQEIKLSGLKEEVDNFYTRGEKLNIYMRTKSTLFKKSIYTANITLSSRELG